MDWVTIKVIVEELIPDETALPVAPATAVAVETSSGVVSVARLDMMEGAVVVMVMIADADVVDDAMNTFILQQLPRQLFLPILYA